jgi:hypothetical protein
MSGGYATQHSRAAGSDDESGKQDNLPSSEKEEEGGNLGNEGRED